MLTAAAAGLVVGAVLATLSGMLWSYQRHKQDSALNNWRRWGAQLARRGAFYVLARTSNPDVLPALREGYAAAGVGLGYLNDTHDLTSTGKFHEVAYYACLRLGIPLRTTGDLRDVLQKIAR